MLLASLGVAQTSELRQTRRERDRADRVTAFMTGMFKVWDPSEARGNDIRAREILDKASKDIHTGLAQDPELQAQMMNVMGNIYQDLGLNPEAESLLRGSVEIRCRALGVRNAETLRSKYDLANVLYTEDLREAARLCRETLEARRQVLGSEHHDTLSSTLQVCQGLRI